MVEIVFDTNGFLVLTVPVRARGDVVLEAAPWRHRRNDRDIRRKRAGALAEGDSIDDHARRIAAGPTGIGDDTGPDRMRSVETEFETGVATEAGIISAMFEIVCPIWFCTMSVLVAGVPFAFSIIFVTNCLSASVVRFSRVTDLVVFVMEEACLIQI